MNKDMLTWKYGLSTHRGTVKDINEDNAFLKIAKDTDGDELTLIIIADGMGGYQAGDVASQVIIDNVNRWWEVRIQMLLESDQPFESIEHELINLFHETNDYLIDYGKKTEKKLGTTATILFLYQGNYLICHVGDSRIYHLENTDQQDNDHHTEIMCPIEQETGLIIGQTILTQLTEDHSWVESQVKQGTLTKEEAANHPRKNVLLQCLGIANGIMPFIDRGAYQPHDVFLLCTDGFYTMFSDSEILSMIRESKQNYENLQSISDYLVNVANDAGATDNITVLLLKSTPVTSQLGLASKFTSFFKRLF